MSSVQVRFCERFASSSIGRAIVYNVPCNFQLLESGNPIILDSSNGWALIPAIVVCLIAGSPSGKAQDFDDFFDYKK